MLLREGDLSLRFSEKLVSGGDSSLKWVVYKAERRDKNLHPVLYTIVFDHPLTTGRSPRSPPQFLDRSTPWVNVVNVNEDASNVKRGYRSSVHPDCFLSLLTVSLTFAGVSLSDEAAVKTRLLFDGDGTGEERRLNLLLKSVRIKRLLLCIVTTQAIFF